jgi:hypothetical protein
MNIEYVYYYIYIIIIVIIKNKNQQGEWQFRVSLLSSPLRMKLNSIALLIQVDVVVYSTCTDII